jgi:hypothetical protein
MKNIFGAKAQTSNIVKSISLLMLVFLVTFGVTSCKNETAPAVTPTTSYESVLDTKAITVPVEVETQKQIEELGTNSEIDYKSLCIGGGTAGQERRTLTIGASQALPRSGTGIGGNETSRRLIAIGGNGSGSTMPRNLTDIGGQSCPRQLSEIGGNQTANRAFSDIGGQGSMVPRALNDKLPNEIPIGGNSTPRSLCILEL